jgi:hypothetical protein
MAEEVRGMLPDSHVADFEIKFEEKMSGLRDLIEEIDNIIINDSVSIEQIDNVLDLIEILDPEVQGEVLATKPVLPNRVDKKASVFKKRPSKPTGAPPTEADIVTTEDILITPPIEALALELGNDVVRLFTWVKNNIDYEPYYGSMKGSVETLIDMAGNDCDQSSLLLALLRASGIPSRYVRGDVELKIEDLMNWTGGKTPEAAVAILQRNKIPTSIIYKFDEIEGVIFDHIWVEAFDGHNWRLMDPSFKTYVYTEGVGSIDISEEDVASFVQTAIISTENTISVNQGAIESFLEAQTSMLEDTTGNLTTDELFGKREILISEKNNLPPYLARGIIGDRKPAEEFLEMSEDMRFKMKAILPGGYEYITSISEIAGTRMSVIYVPATTGDQAILDYFGGIYNVPFPSLTVQMKPVLQIDGETVVTGTSTGLGLSNQSVQIGFLRPGTTGEWEFTNKPLTAGNRYNVYTTTQKTSLAELKRLGEELKSEVIGIPGDTPMTDDMIDNSLYLSGMFYFSMVDVLSDYASKSSDVVSVGHISMGYICNEIKPVGFFGMIWSIARGGAHIDVVRSVKCPTSATANIEDEVAWMGISGFIGTNMESAMFEMLYGIDSVSTGRIFHEASTQGIPIHILDDPETLEADLAVISANSVVKNHIRTYVNEGYTAMIPQRGVTVGSWSGQGWIVMDEESGAAGYMICGGLHGDDTIISGGSLSQAINNLISGLMHLIDLVKVCAMSAGILVTALQIMRAAVLVLQSTLPLLLLAPFSCFFWAIGIALVYVAIVSLITVLNSFKAAWFIRRKEYAYA